MMGKIRPSHLWILVLVGIVTISVGMTAQTPAKGPIAHYTATTDNVSGAGDTVKIDLLSWSTDTDRDQLLAAWTLTASPAAGARGGGGARGAGGPGAAGGRGGGGRGGAAPAPTDGAPPAVAPPADAGAAAPAGRGGGGRGGGGRGGAGAPPAAAAPPETPESSLTAAIQKAPTVGILWTSESTGYSLHYAYRLPQPDGGERIIFATDRRLGVWNNQWKPTGTAKPTDYEFSIIELRLNPKGDGEGKTSLTGKITIDGEGKTIALDGYATLPVVFKGVKRAL